MWGSHGVGIVLRLAAATSVSGYLHRHVSPPRAIVLPPQLHGHVSSSSPPTALHPLKVGGGGAAAASLAQQGGSGGEGSFHRRVSTPPVAVANFAELPERFQNQSRVTQWAMGGGALGVGLAVARGPTVFLLRAAIMVWPFTSAYRLWKNGARRRALTLAIAAVARRFCDRWWQYATIPLFAGFVGWVTNKLAVEMIFKPIGFWGIPILRFPNNPLGWIGWQGIVPCKAGVMAKRLTEIVTGKLLDVQEVFQRISADRFSSLLAPGVDRIAGQVVSEMLPDSDAARRVGLGVGASALRGLPSEAQAELLALRHRYVRDIVRDVQADVSSLVDIDEVMVGGFVREKRMLVDLFQRCGKAELSFLVNSGFGFGILLGVIQMVAWLVYERAWTLAAGGAVVGFLTNWIALKLIFEPVEPVPIGPFRLQGMFLRRQHEVSSEFADCLTEKLLSSESLFDHLLQREGFRAIFHQRTAEFMRGCAAVVYGSADFARANGYWSDLESKTSARVLQLLPSELPLVHGYVDSALDLTATLKTQLRKLTPAEFEQVANILRARAHSKRPSHPAHSLPSTATPRHSHNILGPLYFWPPLLAPPPSPHPPIPHPSIPPPPVAVPPRSLPLADEDPISLRVRCSTQSSRRMSSLSSSWARCSALQWGTLSSCGTKESAPRSRRRRRRAPHAQPRWMQVEGGRSRARELVRTMTAA